MRLFTGLAIPPDISGTLEQLLGELRPLADLKWSPVENLHITTRFIGEWPEAGLESLKDALAATRRPAVFTVSVRGLSFFPGPQQPAVFLAGIDGGDELPCLAHATNDALEAAGCERDTRPFSPHLTLARVKHHNIGQLRKHLENNMANTDFGSFEATSFHLYLSKPGPRGSVYSILASYRIPGSGQAAC